MTLIERLRGALAGEAGQAALRGDWDFEGEGTPSAAHLVPAAVLIPVVARPEPTVLLTRRTDTLRRHAGQVAFPGGRVDPGEDIVAAALREAHEEVALPPNEVEVIGTTDTYETGTGYRITPVVGIIRPDLPLVPAEAEVAALFEAPLDHLLDPANHRMITAEWQGQLRRFYEINWETHRIWGATAGMIVNLAQRMAA